MKYKGLIYKSRTIDFAAVIMMLGAIEQNLPLVREQLGDWYGWILMGIAITVAGLRKVTRGPIGEKTPD